MLLVEADGELDRSTRRHTEWREVYRDDTAAVYVPVDRRLTNMVPASHFARDAAFADRPAFFP